MKNIAISDEAHRKLGDFGTTHDTLGGLIGLIVNYIERNKITRDFFDSKAALEPRLIAHVDVVDAMLGDWCPPRVAQGCMDCPFCGSTGPGGMVVGCKVNSRHWRE